MNTFNISVTTRHLVFKCTYEPGKPFHGIRFGSIDPNSTLDSSEDRHVFGSTDPNMLTLINVIPNLISVSLNLGTLSMG